MIISLTELTHWMCGAALAETQIMPPGMPPKGTGALGEACSALQAR